MEKDDQLSDFKKKYSDLGTFRVDLWREIMGGTGETGSFGPQNVGAVPEKALKGRPLDVATRLVRLRCQKQC